MAIHIWEVTILIRFSLITLADHFKSQENIDLQRSYGAKDQRNRKAKIELSSSNETENLPYITAVDGVPVSTWYFLSLDQSLSNLQINWCKLHYVCEAALKDAGISKPHKLTGRSFLLGGSTRIPKIQQVEEFWKNLTRVWNPDEVVVIGAAIQGGEFYREVKDVLLDVTTFDGIETMGGVYDGPLKLTQQYLTKS